MPEFHQGDRVRAVNFKLDAGNYPQRIWPVDPANDRWRVVNVTGTREGQYVEVFAGGQLACQSRYPDAAFGINDNENVPPGTLGTVESVTPVVGQVFIRWDNGTRLALADGDEVELVAPATQ